MLLQYDQKIVGEPKCLNDIEIGLSNLEVSEDSTEDFMSCDSDDETECSMDVEDDNHMDADYEDHIYDLELGSYSWKRRLDLFPEMQMELDIRSAQCRLEFILKHSKSCVDNIEAHGEVFHLRQLIEDLECKLNEFLTPGQRISLKNSLAFP